MRNEEIVLSTLKQLFLEIQTSSDKTQFKVNFKRFFNNLNNQLFFKTLSVSFDSSTDRLHNEAREIAKKELNGQKYIITDKEEYRQIIAYYILKDIFKNNLNANVDLNHIKKEYLKPFWDLIDHCVTYVNNILYWILKYKKRTEDYDDEKILQELQYYREICRKDKRTPRVEENFFAPRINKYLFDNVTEILIIEPKKRKRRVDVVGLIPAEQGYSDFLIEYKVLLDSQNKEKYLKEAFFQAYDYAKYYHKNKIFLIVFVIGEWDIVLNLDTLPLEADSGLPMYKFEDVNIIAIKIELEKAPSKNELNKDKLNNFFKEKLENLKKLS